MKPIPSVRAVEGPSQPSCWFDRIDVERYRDFRPVVSVTHAADGQLSLISDVADRIFAAPLAAMVLASSVPMLLRALRNPDSVMDEWAFYARPDFLADPDAFFERPPDNFTLARRYAERTTFRPTDGEVWDLFFASPFEPVNPSLRRRYLAHQPNRTAHARYWRHESGPRKTIICVHGYMGSNPSLNTELFNVRWLYKRGLDVLMFVMPFHGDRAGLVDGLHFPNFDLAKVAEGFAHAVYDFRVFLGWLLRQGAPSVGVTGASLGGYMTSLMAAVDGRLDFAVPMIPATSVVDTVVDWASTHVVLGAMLDRVGWELDDARLHTAVHTPLQHPPRVCRDRLMIIGADGDHITRPYQARLLWEHWGGPEIHWYAGSHLVHLHRSSYLRHLGRFLGSLGVFEPRTKTEAALVEPMIG
jgi:dienelactone hydrolase